VNAPAAATAGVYPLSVRRETPEVRTQMRAAAYAHVGMSVEAAEAKTTMLAEAFTATGYDAADLIGLIEGLHALGTAPASVPGKPQPMRLGQGTSDSEDRPTDLFMLGLGSPGDGADAGERNWLACVEAAHSTWPRLLDVLGARVNGVLIETTGDGERTERRIEVSGTRVPKMLRLKAGWDYDAEGNQVWLPIEEAWRRFAAHNETRPADRRMDAKQMKRMRRHMKGGYARRPYTRSTGGHRA
jgi:hypothetical protein